MALTRVARFMGQDVTNLVTSWGNIEQIKDVLLVNATFMTGEHSIELLNRRGAFSPGAGSSLTAGVNWYNQLLEILVDGRTVYQGYVKNITTNNTLTSAKIVSENIFKQPSETTIALSGIGQNPADVMLAIALMGADPSLVDMQSFQQAGGPARAAGATIDYNFPSGSNVTVLSALQQIGALASISCFVLNNRITARAFKPYQGGGSDLQFTLQDSFVREWGDFGFDVSSFNNRVTVGFTGPGSITLNDLESQKINNIVRGFAFPSTGSVVSSNLTSARFFGTLYLQRASLRRGVLPVAGGREFKDVSIGDRFPVTNPRLGLVNFPMEAIEVHGDLDHEEFELHLAQLQPA
jgi:hypothetical protein